MKHAKAKVTKVEIAIRVDGDPIDLSPMIRKALERFAAAVRSRSKTPPPERGTSSSSADTDTARRSSDVPLGMAPGLGRAPGPSADPGSSASARSE